MEGGAIKPDLVVWGKTKDIIGQNQENSKSNSNKHNTELRGTAPGANIPKSMFL